MGRPANPHVGAVLPLSVSAIERWDRCRRHYLLHDLLGVPEPGAGGDATFGLGAHRLLEAVHRDGSCGDSVRTAELADGVDPSVAGRLATAANRHAARCPGDASEWAAHEHGAARFQREPPPMFMLTGRFDAVWAYGGVLAAHDYKTGAPRVDRVADLVAGRVQAWLLAPLARARGRPVRVVYEYLDSPPEQWPDPYEPEEEDLAGTGEELRAIAAAIRDETEFVGSGDERDCRWCAYRPICRDAAPEAADVDAAAHVGAEAPGWARPPPG